MHGSPDFQKDRRVFQGCPTFSSTGVRSLCPKELVKDLLNKQKGHMNKIRAFLTAKPSEPRRGHVRGTWPTGKTGLKPCTLDGDDCDFPQVFEWPGSICTVWCGFVHGVTCAYVFFIWSVGIGSRLWNLCFACCPDPCVFLQYVLELFFWRLFQIILRSETCSTQLRINQRHWFLPGSL